MREQLILQQVEFVSHIGVTAVERQSPQPIGVDLELDYPERALHAVAAADDITKAIDYCAIAERVRQTGGDIECALLETLAERLCSMLFAEFPISRARLWIRKLTPPVKDVHGSVGVRLDRTQVDQMPEPRPAQFLLDHWQKLSKGEILDVAAGRGRNALFLAAQGFSVEAIDRDDQALGELATMARRRNLPGITMRTLDLEQDPDHPPDFPKERYDGILVFFYLHRPIVPALLQALKPGGILIYETFLIENHLRYQHPRRREFCLAHNELLRLTAGLRALHYEEGARAGGHGAETIFTAKLVAQKE